jgi:hypothetical protein
MTVTGVWFNQRLVKRHRQEVVCSRAGSLCYIALFYATEDSLSPTMIGLSKARNDAKAQKTFRTFRAFHWKGSVQNALSVSVNVPTFSGNPSRYCPVGVLWSVVFWFATELPNLVWSSFQ